MFVVVTSSQIACVWIAKSVDDTDGCTLCDTFLKVRSVRKRWGLRRCV